MTQSKAIWDKRVHLPDTLSSSEFVILVNWLNVNCGRRGVDWLISAKRYLTVRYKPVLPRFKKIVIHFNKTEHESLFKLVWLYHNQF